MKVFFKIDENGYYTEPIELKSDTIPSSNLVEIPPPNGLYRAKWTGVEWVEDMTQDEIDSLNNQIRVPTKEEMLEQELANTNALVLELTELILGGM